MNNDESALPDNDQLSQLREVRAKAISALGEAFLSIENNDPQERFEGALNLLKYGANGNIANIAFESALAIQDAQTRSDLLSQLINEIAFLEDSLKS